MGLLQHFPSPGPRRIPARAKSVPSHAYSLLPQLGPRNRPCHPPSSCPHECPGHSGNSPACRPGFGGLCICSRGRGVLLEWAVVGFLAYPTPWTTWVTHSPSSSPESLSSKRRVESRLAARVHCPSLLKQTLVTGPGGKWQGRGDKVLEPHMHLVMHPPQLLHE